jgi:RHS repeat-associated protein
VAVRHNASTAVNYLLGGDQLVLREGTAPYQYLYGDHLNSATLTTDAAGTRTSETRYYPYGAHRFDWGRDPSDRDFTGQRRDAEVALLDYVARRYSPYLGRFVSPDSIVPEPGNPQSLNRYAYVRNNPLRYTDPTGHWTEDELAAVLGQDWRASYFGKDKVFEGRDELLHLLTSANSTNLIELTLIHDIMVPTSILHNSGVAVRSLDAVGLRLTFSGGAYIFGGGTADVLLNVKSGEFSVFGSGEVGGILGGAGNITVGMLGVRNLPSNESYRGPVLALGGVGGDGPASQVEYFWSSPVSDRFEATDKANGWAVTLGGGAGAGIYGSIAYSYEMLRQTSAGMELLPHPPGMGAMINELSVALYHDFLLHPWWPWSPYTK